MQLKKGQIIELEIESLAFGGAGIGRHEGLTVFVKKAFPGDRVEASFTKIKKKYAEASFVKLIRPSEDRVDAKCKYFGVCGGCQLQSIPYEMQLSIKKQQVIDAFERIGNIKNPPVEDVIGCKEPYYYRNKMEFSFGYDKEMKFALGLHMPGRRYDILDLDECHLQSEFSAQILNKVREFCLAKKWLPRKFHTKQGFMRTLYIREGKRTGEVMINLVTTPEVPKNFELEMKNLVKELLELTDEEKKIISVYWSKKVCKRGTPTRIEETLVHGKKTLCEKMILENGDELSFEILPQAFFQVNTFQAEILYSQILKMVEESSHKCVFDLYCGTGTIGLFLAKHVEEVVGIELNEDAIKMARENAQKNNVFNIDFFCGSTEEVLKQVKQVPSLIVVDPPRAGLTPKTIEQINNFGCDQLIYVSCNPSTLARDCELLGEYGYKVKKIQPVDMFPHTFHIENVVLLER